MNSSYVVTGGGRGIGRAIVERLLQADPNGTGKDSTADSVVTVLESDRAALDWLDGHPGRERLIPIVGDASDETVAARAAEAAATAAPQN